MYILRMTCSPKIEVIDGSRYPGFQRIFFLIDNEAALKQKKAARRKKNYFFLLGALRLVNAASPRTISVHKKKISSGTQGRISLLCSGELI